MMVRDSSRVRRPSSPPGPGLVPAVLRLSDGEDTSGRMGSVIGPVSNQTDQDDGPRTTKQSKAPSPELPLTYSNPSWFFRMPASATDERPRPRAARRRRRPPRREPHREQPQQLESEVGPNDDDDDDGDGDEKEFGADVKTFGDDGHKGRVPVQKTLRRRSWPSSTSMSTGPPADFKDHGPRRGPALLEARIASAAATTAKGLTDGGVDEAKEGGGPRRRRWR
jgi:hypothetical protein